LEVVAYFCCRLALPRVWGLRHHLALAGRNDTLFSDDAVALIHQTSRGYPRAVNNIALQALVAAFAADKTIVDEKSARTAVAEVTAE
jgi:type II secretory pathway predicted ATPase ExeA